MPEQKRNCIEWIERKPLRGGSHELFFITAEKISEKWEFFERSTWEVRWYEISTTPQLRERLEIELKKRSQSLDSPRRPQIHPPVQVTLPGNCLPLK